MQNHYLVCLLFFLGFSLFSQEALHVWTEKMGVDFEWDASLDQAHLLYGEQKIILDFWGRFAYSSGGEIRILDYSGGPDTGYILSESLITWMSSLFFPVLDSKIGVIIIDPGHGGRDPGALGRLRIGEQTIQLNEKDVVLRVGEILAEKLSASYPDKRILLTRDHDVFLTLEERVEIAHQQELGSRETILFISIHANASFNTRANGFEIWHIPQDYSRILVDESALQQEQRSLLPILNDLINREYKRESIRLANILSRSLENALGDQSPNRGLKEEAWFVVRMARMPAVLVELGFLTHSKEVQLLSRGEYLKLLAQGLYNGLAQYIQVYETRGR